jgi:hypothetical protein
MFAFAAVFRVACVFVLPMVRFAGRPGNSRGYDYFCLGDFGQTGCNVWYL